MGKVLTTDNPDSYKALRFSNKRKDAQLLLDKTDNIKMLVDNKEVFNIEKLNTSLANTNDAINIINNDIGELVDTNNSQDDRLNSLESYSTYTSGALPLTGTEVIRILQNGNNKKITAQDVANLTPTSLLGGITYNAAAPTPGKSGKYSFTTGGTCTWLTEGAATVAVGDEVVVVFTAPSTYTYTKVGRPDIEQVRSQSTTKVPSSKLVDDELNLKIDESKLNSLITQYNATVSSPVEPDYYSLSTAIAAVPVNIRKNGLEVLFLYGQKEEVTLTILSNATSNGNITVTLAGVPYIIAVSAGDLIDDILTKINNASFSGFSTKVVSTINDTIVLKADNAMFYSIPKIDFSTTGVTGRIIASKLGIDERWESHKFKGDHLTEFTDLTKWNQVLEKVNYNIFETKLKYSSYKISGSPFWIESSNPNSNIKSVGTDYNLWHIKFNSTGTTNSEKNTIFFRNNVQVSAGKYLLEFDYKFDGPENYMVVYDYYLNQILSCGDKKSGRVKVELNLISDVAIQSPGTGNGLFKIVLSENNLPKDLYFSISNISLMNESYVIDEENNSSTIIPASAASVKRVREIVKDFSVNYYIDSVDGDDIVNDGSMEFPWKTLSKITSGTSESYNVYYLKRGSIFYESVQNKSFIKIKDYGVGEPPIITAKKNIFPGTWTVYDAPNNIWVCNLTDNRHTGRGLDLVGVNTTNNFRYSVGAIIDNGANMAYHNNAKTLLELNSSPNWALFQAGLPELAAISSTTFNNLYLKLDYNPNNVDISVSLSYDIFRSVTDSYFENLVMFAGAYGMRACQRITASNCKYDVIGGQLFSTTTTTAWGNGIDMYNNTYDVLSTNSKFSRIFDVGFTPQFGADYGPPSGGLTIPEFRNDICQNGVFYKCSNSYEIFNRYSANGDTNYDDAGIYDNCLFKNNVCIYDGYTEMNVSNDDTAGTILIWGQPFYDAQFSDNLVILPRVLIKSKPMGLLKFYNNKIYIKQGDYLYSGCDMPLNKTITISTNYLLSYILKSDNRLSIGDTFNLSSKLVISGGVPVGLRIDFRRYDESIISTIYTSTQTAIGSIIDSGDIVVPPDTYEIRIFYVSTVGATITMNSLMLKTNGKVFRSSDIVANRQADIDLFNELVDNTTNQIIIVSEAEANSFSMDMMISGYIKK